MSLVAETLKNAIEQRGAETAAARRDVYSSARKALQRLPLEIRDRHVAELELAIEQIERGQEVPFGAEAVADIAIDWPTTSFADERNPALVHGRRWTRIIVVFGTLLVFPLVIWLIVARNGMWENNDAARYSSDADIVASLEIAGSAAQVIARMTVDFARNVDLLADRPTGELSSPDAISSLSDDKGLLIRGRQAIYTKSAFAIETGSAYIGTLEFSVQDVERSLRSLSVGFVALNAYQEVLGGKASSSRYFVHRGRLKPANVIASGNRGVVTGIIDGVAAEGHKRFPPETKFVRPVVWIATGSDMRWIRLHKFTVEQVE